MNRYFLLLFTIILLQSCKSNTSSSNSSSSYDDDDEIAMEDVQTWEDAQRYREQTGDYPDGTYCANVEYYNYNTSTRNDYSLDVEVAGGDLVQINWPNGGWLDETHFSSEDISSGDCSFTSDKGVRYTVTLGDFGGCGYTDSYKIQRDANNDIEESTCPECGSDKDSYDEYCYYCKRKFKCEECGSKKDKYEDFCDDCIAKKERKKKEEESCKRCGGHKYSSFDDYCSSCERKIEEEQEED